MPLAAGMESFAEAFDQFSDPGVDRARACVAVGWAVADMISLLPQLPPPDPPVVDCPPGLTVVSDLPPDSQWNIRIVQIQVALDVLQFPTYPQGPDLDSLKFAAGTDVGSLTAGLCSFHKGFLSACAAVEAKTAPASDRAAKSDNSPAATPVGLTKCYEVGRLLSGITIKGSTDKSLSSDDIKALVTLHSQSVQAADEGASAADRAHALLADIRASLPSAAAYSAARHMEDWSAWVNGDPLDSAANWETMRSRPEQVRAALAEQGQVWHTILSGQTLARDYLVPTSYADAADHLLLHWASRVQSLVRSFLRTIVGKVVVVVLAIALAVFLSAFIIALQDPHTSGAKSGLSLAAILTAVGTAAGTFHVSRQRISSTVGEVWSLVEPTLVEAEMKEAIAQATRRLPTESIGGSSAAAATSSAVRAKRARKATLPLWSRS
jgi:hypothetical protein